jgi:hypothetical protein
MHTKILKVNGNTVFTANSDSNGKANFAAMEMYHRAQCLINGVEPVVEIEEVEHEKTDEKKSLFGGSK